MNTQERILSGDKTYIEGINHFKYDWSYNIPFIIVVGVLFLIQVIAIFRRLVQIQKLKEIIGAPLANLSSQIWYSQLMIISFCMIAQFIYNTELWVLCMTIFLLFQTRHMAQHCIICTILVDHLSVDEKKILKEGNKHPIEAEKEQNTSLRKDIDLELEKPNKNKQELQKSLTVDNRHLEGIQYPTTRKCYQREYLKMIMKAKYIPCLSKCCKGTDVSDVVDACQYLFEIRWMYIILFTVTIIGEVIIIVLEAKLTDAVQTVGIVAVCQFLHLPALVWVIIQLLRLFKAFDTTIAQGENFHARFQSVIDKNNILAAPVLVLSFITVENEYHDVYQMRLIIAYFIMGILFFINTVVMLNVFIPPKAMQNLLLDRLSNKVKYHSLEKNEKDNKIEQATSHEEQNALNKKDYSGQLNQL